MTASPSLMACAHCGESNASVFPPTCDKRTPYYPADRAFPVVRCSCGVEVGGKDWDQSGKSAIAAWNRRATPPLPAGFVAVPRGTMPSEWVMPRELLVEAGTWEAAKFVIGSPEDGYCDAVLSFGVSHDDQDRPVFGLHVHSADYPDEGCITLAEIPELATTPDINSYSKISSNCEATESDVRLAMARAASLVGTQKEWAASIGISEQYASDLLNGRRAPTEELAATVGYRRVWLATAPPPPAEPAAEGREALHPECSICRRRHGHEVIHECE